MQWAKVVTKQAQTSGGGYTGCVHLAYLGRFYKDISVQVSNYPTSTWSIYKDCKPHKSHPSVCLRVFPYMLSVQIFSPSFLSPKHPPFQSLSYYYRTWQPGTIRALYLKVGFTERGYKLPQACK